MWKKNSSLRVPRLLVALAFAHVALAGSSENESQTTSDGISDLPLQYVAVLFRHGARAPIRLIPTDKAYWRWPNGLGQVTSMGLRQQYELGQFLRKRYITSTNFLNPLYDHTQLFVYATDFERTFLSARAHISGLYCDESTTCLTPEKRKHVVQNDDFEIRQDLVDFSNMSLTTPPVPIHTFTNISDKLPCPYYDKLFLPSTLDVTLSPDDMNLMGQWTGYGQNMSASLSYVSDALYCIRAHGYSLPSWCTQEVYDKLQYIASGKCENFPDAYKSNVIARAQVLVGAVLYDIVRRFNASSSGQAFQMANINLANDINREAMHPEAVSGFRMVIYSMHDTQVNGALKVLDNCELGTPKFASALLFELRRATQSPNDKYDDEDYVVQVLFVTDTDGVRSAQPLNITSCPAPCTLRAFRQAVEPFLLSDLPNFCLNGPAHSNWIQQYLTPDDFLKFIYAAFASIFFLSGLAIGIVIVVIAARCFPCIRSCIARLSNEERQRQLGYRPLLINEENGELTDDIVSTRSNGRTREDMREVDSHEQSSVL